LKSYDYLIVGQGLAGSLLSWFLIDKGASVLVIDPEEKNTSSKVAAGLIHPITGRRMVLSWRADEFVPYSIQTFRSIEKALKKHFFYDIPVLEIFQNYGHQNDWLAQSENSLCKPFLGKQLKASDVSTEVNAPLGGQFLINGGWLNTNAFLAAMKDLLISKDSYRKQELDFKDLKFNDDELLFQDIKFKKVIFCDGYKARTNPLFSYLPFNPAKGELLTIQSIELKLDYVAHNGIKVIPLGKDQYLCGANYSWDEFDETPTAKGLKFIQDGISKCINSPYVITNHTAGVRPATADRRPFLGLHSNNNKAGIFNGLGSKGVMMGPWLAERMSSFLVNNEPLEKEFSVERFNY